MLWLAAESGQRRLLDSPSLSNPSLAIVGGAGSISPGDATVTQPAGEEGKKLQRETVTKLRTLAHDLSNSIETIMQASYLLGQAELDDNNRKWLELVDTAAQDAARINREIREILRTS